MAMSRVRHVCPRTSGTPQLCHSHHPHLAVSLRRARASTGRAGTWPSSHRAGCKSSGKEKENVCGCQVRRGHRPARAPAPHRHQAPWARQGRGSPPGGWVGSGGALLQGGSPDIPARVVACEERRLRNRHSNFCWHQPCGTAAGASGTGIQAQRPSHTLLGDPQTMHKSLPASCRHRSGA